MVQVLDLETMKIQLNLIWNGWKWFQMMFQVVLGVKKFVSIMDQFDRFVTESSAPKARYPKYNRNAAIHAFSPLNELSKLVCICVYKSKHANAFFL